MLGCALNSYKIDYIFGFRSVILERPAHNRRLRTPLSFLIDCTPTGDTPENGIRFRRKFLKRKIDTKAVLTCDGDQSFKAAINVRFKSFQRTA